MSDEISEAEAATKKLEGLLKAAEENGAGSDIVDGKEIPEVDIRSETERLKSFIAELSHKELFAHIEGGAKTLLKFIEAIPEGIAHDYHGLAAEIRSRV